MQNDNNRKCQQTTCVVCIRPFRAQPSICRNTANASAGKAPGVAAMLRIRSRGETRLSRPRGFGVATDVAGRLRILPTRAESCPAWASRKRCGVAAKNWGPASASEGHAPRCPTNPFGMTAYRNLELVLPATSCPSRSAFNLNIRGLNYHAQRPVCGKQVAGAIASIRPRPVISATPPLRTFVRRDDPAAVNGPTHLII